MATITIPWTFKSTDKGLTMTGTFYGTSAEEATERFSAALRQLGEKLAEIPAPMTSLAMALSTTGYAPGKVIDLPPADLDDCPPEVEIQVNLMDIYMGERGDSERCAVSRAAQRRFDGAKVSVGHNVMVVYVSGHAPVTYQAMGEDAASFIRRFDREWHVSPCVLSYRRVV